MLAGLVPELGPAGTASGPRAADLVPWFFARLLDGAPAVVVIEDAHEADPLSLDVLRRTAAQADPVLWMITAREVPDGPWAQARTELIRGERPPRPRAVRAAGAGRDAGPRRAPGRIRP